MVEVPEYLLQRSKERRIALGDEGPEGGSQAESAELSKGSEAGGGEDKSGSGEKTPVAAKGKTLAPIPEKPEPEEAPLPPSVIEAAKRQRIPMWIMPVLLFLPVWAFIYVGTLEEPTRGIEGILGDGEEVYSSVAACATCHGGSGAGTNSGPSLTKEELLLTFPDDEQGLGLAQHIEWVVKATDGIGVGRPYGSPEQGRVAGWFGNMPDFGTAISGYDLLAAVLYERAVLGESETSKTQALQLEEALITGNLELPENWAEDATVQDILLTLQKALAGE